MNVKEARDIVKGMEMTPEAVVRIDEILAGFTEEETLPNEIIDKIIAIIDIEMDATKLAADIYQAGAQMADLYINKVEEEAGKIVDGL